MAAIITSKFRFHNAEQFKESFSEAAPTNYYMFIGRPSAFASSTTGGTDSAPPTPVDNRRSEAYHWDDMLAAKKIDSTGVTHAIPRRDLDVSGATTYDMYRPNYSSSNTANSGATTLFDSTFYFMTSAYRVYKVLENKNNAAWTAAEPTATDAAPFTTGGYTIKYMFTLSTTQVQNFLTPDFIPALITPESGNARADGALDIIKVSTAGLSLVGGGAWAESADRNVINVPVRGDGTGALATITIAGTTGSDDGKITACAVSSAGSGYTHGTILLADIIEQHNIQNTGEALTFSSNPTFEVVIGPDGGHGSNPARELGGHFCLTDVKLQQTEAFDFSVVNDFRQIGICRNPYSYGTTSVFTGSTARQTYAIKLASNSGEFQVDEKITQTIAAVAIKSSGGMTVSGSVITVNTDDPHKLATGQMVKITNGVFAGGATTGHQGTHHITVTDADTFTFTVSTSRTPTGSFTKGTGASACVYTTFVPQGIVVEYDVTNKIIFYVQTVYDNQGTDATYKQTIPFSSNSTITGATSTATGVPDTSSSATVNNTVFVAGYSNPELQPDTGDVIYIENRKPISRASDQTEDVKLVVEF